jgi:PAS domain S-box-containing protein
LTLATRLVQAVDLPDPIGAALRAIGETLRSPNVAYYAFDPVDSTIVMTHATVGDTVAREAIARHRLGDESVASRTLREQSPIIIADYHATDEVQAALVAVGINRVYNLVSLPITVGETRFGVVQAVNVARRYVGPRAKAGLEEIATLFGAMLASARSRNEVATLGTMIARANASLHLKETLDAILEGLMTLVPSAAATIHLDGLIQDALAQVARRTVGTGEEYPSSQPRPLHGSIVGWVYRHRQSLNVPDILADERVLRTGPDALPPTTTVRSHLVIPLIVGDDPVGTLTASRRGVSAYTDNDLRAAEQFAPLAARAVANARLYARAEDARQQAEVIIEDMADAIVRIDRDGIARGWNRGAERLFGHMAGDVIGGSPPLVPLDAYPETAGIWQRVLDNGEGFGYVENRQRHKDGRWLDTLVSLSPWREDGQIVGAVAVIRDITARKALERELAERVAAVERQERDTAFVAAVAQACNSGADAPAMLQMLTDLAARWADSSSVVTFEGEHVGLSAYASKTPEEDAAIRQILEQT